MEKYLVDSVEALEKKLAEVRDAQRKFALYTQEQVDEIFKKCDFITIHVPLMDSTKRMVDKEAIGMKYRFFSFGDSMFLTDE